ncbi:DUF2199 domain-containing protein [Puniceibacterium sp. IMCC21224]|uniref:DUF2199 domain-containing protein n=1 Tax=Puniceibacterium sp. IMCC21224 TaxID=1618204 RepID=UPI00065D1BEC|nr:DUF2199 domain-containing protein [Puniceibacterium sp. IMCC21224]KMK67352.1 hypothetical protein IMCC21224_112220 [Puniceibacterium sp. IMCC21224]
MTLLDLDARWRRFNDPDYACPCCGRSFGGVFDIGFEEPDVWPHGPRDGDVRQQGQDKLSSELCRFDDQRFLRCVVALPLRGTENTFFFGPWAEIAPHDFYAYLDGVTEDGDDITSLPATLGNLLPGYEPALAGALLPGSGLERPRFVAASGPLAEAQRDGISFDDLLDIYAACGQDIRPHLKG